MKEENLSYKQICQKNPKAFKDSDFKLDKDGNVRTTIVLGNTRYKPKT